MSSTQEERRALTDEDRRNLMRQAGNALLVNIHSLMRAASLHDINNRSLDRPADGVIEALAALRRVERAAIAMNISQGAVYINANRLAVDQQSFTFVQSLEVAFGRVDSSGLKFANDVTTDQVKTYLHFFNKWKAPAGEKHVLPLFRKDLKQAGIAGVEPTPRVRIAVDQDERRLPGVLGLQTYAKLLAAFARLLAAPRIPLSLAQRLVQDLLDALREEGDLLVGLALMPVEEMTFERRTLNTAIITLMMTQNLGTYTRTLLSEVGLATLLFRLPERRRSGELAQTSQDAEQDALWAPLESLDQPSELTSAGVRTILASFERHKQTDGQGPPELIQPSRPLASSQLIRLAQELQDRLYPNDGKVQSRPVHEVLAELLQHPGGHAPEALVLLLQSIGLLPLGTLIELSTGEIGVVVRPPRHEPGMPPQGVEGTRVKLLFDKQKNKLPGSTIVTLGEPSPAGGPWRLQGLLDSREDRQLSIQPTLEDAESVMLQLRLP